MIERPELLLGAITDGVIVQDENGRALFANAAAARLLGHASEAAMIGGTPQALYARVDLAAEWGDALTLDDLPTSRALAEHAPSERVVRLTLREPGESRFALVKASPAAGGLSFVVTLLQDVTSAKLAEVALRERAAELARAKEALERSNRELDQFAYVTSHDLKAPLRGIANLSRWIEEDVGEALSEESRRQMQLLRKRVVRMEGLIDAILEYSRVGRVRARPERVDVNELVADTIDFLSPPPTFRFDVQPGLPTLVTEKLRLQQVFLNLIGNAVKHHSRADGLVRMRCEDADRFWKFTVADDGPGIAPRFHERVFVIFQTLEARDKVESTGLGLAIVKKIVENVGGAVTLDSDEGRGAAFSFTWPKG